MNTIFSILIDTPSAISEAATQPDPATLSLDELRICFPGRIAMIASGEECIVLDEAPKEHGNSLSARAMKSSISTS